MNHKLFAPLLITSLFIFANPALAEDSKPHGGHHGMGATKGGHGEMGKGHHGDDKQKGGHKKKKGHHFSPHWARTLDEQQRVAVDRMHLSLDRELAVLKAKAQLLQKELNVMTAKDGADQAAIHAGIDELMALKAEIMKLRYDHLSEMRTTLNEQQRLSYDMAILKRKGAQ